MACYPFIMNNPIKQLSSLVIVRRVIIVECITEGHNYSNDVNRPENKAKKKAFVLTF